MQITPESIPFTQGLHRLSERCYAWLQPAGGFCLSNAGLITSDGDTLLVDTLIDRNRTAGMLEQMKEEVPSAARIAKLVNTHGDCDHTGGNCLLPQAHSIMARGAAEHYATIESFVEKMYSASGDARRMFDELGLGTLFDPRDVRYRKPDEIFEGKLSVKVGSLRIDLQEFGPAHNKSDTVVHVERDGVVYAGDLMFCDCHPVLGYWPIENWVKICDTFLSWGANIFVPGHGPVAGPAEVRRHRDYVILLHDEARLRYAKGMSVEDAAYDIFVSFPEFQGLYRGDILRKNVLVVYHELMGKPVTEDFVTHTEARWRFRERIRGLAKGIHFNHVPDGN